MFLTFHNPFLWSVFWFTSKNETTRWFFVTEFSSSGVDRFFTVVFQDTTCFRWWSWEQNLLRPWAHRKPLQNNNLDEGDQGNIAINHQRQPELPIMGWHAPTSLQKSLSGSQHEKPEVVGMSDLQWYNFHEGIQKIEVHQHQKHHFSTESAVALGRRFPQKNNMYIYIYM